MIGLAKKVPMNPRAKTALRPFFQVLVLAICIYGVYLFIDRRFWEELFHLIDYQKEYDESKTCLVYLMESAIMSSMFVAVTYYAKKFALYKKQAHRKETL